VVACSRHICFAEVVTPLFCLYCDTHIRCYTHKYNPLSALFLRPPCSFRFACLVLCWALLGMCGKYSICTGSGVIAFTRHTASKMHLAHKASLSYDVSSSSAATARWSSEKAMAPPTAEQVYKNFNNGNSVVVWQRWRPLQAAAMGQLMPVHMMTTRFLTPLKHSDSRSGLRDGASEYLR
jgi:hypothetical protein